MACNPVLQNAVLSFAAGNFPDGYCPSSYQVFANDIAAALSGTLPGNFTAWNVTSDSPAPPAPNDNAKPWLKLDPSTCAPVGVYVWSAAFGAWVSRHPCFPGMVIMYEGTDVSVPSLDGGDGGDIGTVTQVTGPMWQIISEMAAKFPIGPGTLPGYQAVPVPTTITVGVNGGIEGNSVVVGAANVPPHVHNIACPISDAAAIDSTTGQFKTNLQWADGEASTLGGKTRSNIPDPLGTKPLEFSNLPPYRGIWFLRKTARLYYKA
jgi:hypothetical protein